MCSTFEEKCQLADRYKGSENCVWVEFETLKEEYEPVNLSTGFANFPPHELIRKALKEAASNEESSLYQYTKAAGHPRLIEAISVLYAPMYDRCLTADNIISTVGAQGALTCIINAFINPGDEVIGIEPMYDSYAVLVKGSSAILKTTVLEAKKNVDSTSNDWTINFSDFESLFTEKTKMVILNTPQNPIGKVYTQEELEKIAELCLKWDCICLSDDVYEWLVYPESKFCKMANIPGMWDRTITVSSAGKAFHVTGWKVGWAIGPEYLINNCKAVHQHTIFACSTPMQEAVAIAIEKILEQKISPEFYFTKMLEEVKSKRNFLYNKLKSIGMSPIMPTAGYFMMADISSISSKVDLSKEEGPLSYKFVKWLIKNIKIQCVPTSIFFTEKNVLLSDKYVRFCFMKDKETLDKGAEKLDLLKLRILDAAKKRHL